MHRHRLAVAACAALSLLLAACGGDEPAPQTSPSPTATETHDHASTPGPTSTGGCEDQTGEEEMKVEMHDDFFEPTCLVVLSTQNLRLENEGQALHSFTIDDTPVDVDVQPGVEEDREAIGGAVEPGTYAFHCKYHPEMTGELTVQ